MDVIVYYFYQLHQNPSKHYSSSSYTTLLLYLKNILKRPQKHPNRGLTFKASDIIKCHSDASYEPGFRSRSDGLYYFGNKG